MPASASASHSLGAELKTDPAIASAIDTIVERVAERSAQITDVRPAREGASES